jgi:hypothetical protein
MGASKKVGSFDPREVNLAVAGVTVTGYADGAFIEVARSNDAWDATTGANGEVARTRTVDDMGTIVVTLQMSSDSNDDFSALAIADEKTGKASFPVIMKDSNGTSVAAGSVAWFQKLPTVTFSKGVEVREWTITVAHLELFVGGSADITP